jgi:hypothetical protein
LGNVRVGAGCMPYQPVWMMRTGRRSLTVEVVSRIPHVVPVLTDQLRYPPSDTVATLGDAFVPGCSGPASRAVVLESGAAGD